MSHTRYDVAIIGLGPVGSLATILLAEAGLNIVVIEKDPEVYRLPRAVNLDGEIIRALQPSNLAHQVDAIVQTIRPGERAGFTNSKREWLFGADSVPFASNGWQPANMFDQPELEAFLREQALSYQGVTSRIDTTITQVDQTEKFVKLKGTDHGASVELEANYLVACDGASSPTRKALNIPWRDLGYNHQWLVVDVTTNDQHTLTNEVLQVCDPNRLHTYVATKDPYRRWEFRMNPGETAEQMLKEDTIHSLIAPWTPRDSYEIRRAAVYEFHAATAAQWRRGRIFLAGDAAHQTPPFLGQGMNTGMRDVINLAWKLPLVLSGACSPELLNSYELERDAHAHDLVSWAVALGRLMEFTAEKEACARRGDPEPKAPENHQASGYGQGREQPPIRSGAVLQEQVSDSGITGYLFNQPIVQDNAGAETRLDQHLGEHFALVGFDLRNLKLKQKSQDIMTRLNIRLVDLNHFNVVRGRFAKFDHAQLVLVRPDRIVFGHTTSDLDADDLIQALANLVHLNIS